MLRTPEEVDGILHGFHVPNRAVVHIPGSNPEHNVPAMHAYLASWIAIVGDSTHTRGLWDALSLDASGS